MNSEQSLKIHVSDEHFRSNCFSLSFFLFLIIEQQINVYHIDELMMIRVYILLDLFSMGENFKSCWNADVALLSIVVKIKSPTFQHFIARLRLEQLITKLNKMYALIMTIAFNMINSISYLGRIAIQLTSYEWCT